MVEVPAARREAAAVPAPARPFLNLVMNAFSEVMPRRRLLSVAAPLFGLAGLLGDALAAESFVRIGTGGDPGVYYAAGAGICRAVNAARERHGVRCHVAPSGGSLATLRQLQRGELELGILQSDWQYNAHRGRAQFAAEGGFEALRALFSLHPEAFTIVARKEAGIARFSDLRNRRVNIGNPGSGQRATLELLLGAVGWSTADFALAAELKTSEQSRALCNEDIDAFVFIAGVPNDSVTAATEGCGAVLAGMDQEILDGLEPENPGYERVSIPGGSYRGNPHDVHTFGVRATVVTSKQVPEDIVEAVVRSVFEDLSGLQQQHPALADLTPEEMVKLGLTAPLHAGARRYYQANDLR